MKTIEIYKKYKTPPNLQKHMLRVAALGKIITSQWTSSSINGRAIVQTLLFHDLGKPISFDPNKQAEFINDPKEQKEIVENIYFLRKKYGVYEHQATLKMFKEIGLKEQSLYLINNFDWSNTQRLINSKKIEHLITIYAEMRISPSGIVDLDQRLKELKSRQSIKNFQQRLNLAKQLEKMVAQHTKASLNNINNTDLDKYKKRLLDLKIP
jgi:5'-deoxynucleotidase YfbR-like HD superfamily hydrolase